MDFFYGWLCVASISKLQESRPPNDPPSRSSVHTHRESKDARCRRGRFNAIGTGASSSSKGFYFVQASKNIGEPIIDEPCGKAGGGRKGSGPNARNAWTPTHRLIGVGCQTKKANYKKTKRPG